MKSNRTEEGMRPVFIPEWTVWDKAISRHYEKSSKDAKDFLYALLQKRVVSSVEFAFIPTELHQALKGAFSNRRGFSFLIENGAAIEPLPEVLTRVILNAMPDPIPHELAVVFLAFWKMMSSNHVYIVTEDHDFKKAFDQMASMGMKITHIKPISCKKALAILNEIS